MPKPNVECEICLSGKIEISDLENLEILNNVQKKILNYNSKYFDNDDLYLLNNSLGLRLRYENSFWMQTLKYEKRDQSRLEWNSRSCATNIKNPPKLDQMVLPNIRTLKKNGCILEKDLQSVAHTLDEQFSIEIKRTLWVINYHGSEVEFTYDSGLIKTSSKQDKVSEIELELVKGKPNTLWILAKYLLKVLPNLCFEYQSKAFRGFLLNGLDWEKFKPIDHLKVIGKSFVFKQILKETLLLKNKQISFLISIITKKNGKKSIPFLIEKVTEIKYIFQFLIISKIYESKKNQSFYKALRFKCSTLEKELKISNDTSFENIIFLQNTQILIADIGLFANSLDSLILKTDVDNYIRKFFLKIEESIDKRKKSLNGKEGYKLIKFNSNFFLNLGISEKTIIENQNLDLSAFK